MKRKLLGFVLAICLAVPCAVILSACGDNTIYAGKNLTLEEAVTQAEVGGIIKLDSNITLDESVIIDKQITIDLAGYTINNTTDLWNTDEHVWSLISVRENGNLTIKNGMLSAKEDDCYAIDVRDGGKLIIESGKYIGNVHCIYVLEGEAVIKGGEFDIKQLDNHTGDSRYTLNCYDANYREGTAKITVSGGKFANYDPQGSTSENPTANFLAEGYRTQELEQDENGDVWYEVVAE